MGNTIINIRFGARYFQVTRDGKISFEINSYYKTKVPKSWFYVYDFFGISSKGGLMNNAMDVAADAIAGSWLTIVGMFEGIATRRKVASIMAMGNMKTIGRFGFEWWGDLRPAQMETPDGVVYEPWKFGIWIRSEE